MADANLRVIITAATAGLAAGLRSARGQLANFGSQARAAGVGLSAGLTLPIAGAATMAVKSAIDFESSFAGIRKTVDATEGQFAELSAGMRKLATTIPVNVNELNKIGQAAGQLGIRTENILAFTRVIADLGVATNLASEEGATQLARFANIVQMPQENFDRLGSTIVDLGNNLATTEAEIVEMGLRIAGAGAQVGLTEAQILGFAGALSSVGIEAQAGGTAISRVMIETANVVATGGQKLVDFAAVAGLSAGEFRDAFKTDAAAAIIKFVEGLGRMSAAGENVFGILDQLGLNEIRVRDALLRASGAGDVLRRSIDLGTEAWRENRALTEEAEKRYGTMSSQLEIVKNKLMDVVITIGTPLLEALGTLLDKLTPVFDMLAKAGQGFADLDTNTQLWILAIAGLVAAIGPALIVIGAMASGASVLVGAIGALATPAGLAAAAIGGVTIGLILLGFATTDVKGLLSSLGEVMRVWVIPAFQDFIAGDFGAGFTKLQEGAAAAADLIKGKWQDIGPQFAGALKEGIPKVLDALLELATKVVEWLKANGGLLIGGFGEWVANTVGWVAEAIPGLIDNLRILLGKVLDWITDNAPGLLEKLIGEWVPIWIGWIAKAIAGIAVNLPEILVAIAKFVIEAVPKILELTVKMGFAIVSGIITGLTNLATILWDVIGQALQDMGAKIKNIGPSLWEGLVSSFKVAVNSLIDILNKLIEGFNSFFSFGGFGPKIPAIPHIPVAALQQGGIVRQPVMALLGEKAPMQQEAVIPLRRGQNIMALTGTPIVVRVVLDSRVIAEAHGRLAVGAEQVRSG